MVQGVHTLTVNKRNIVELMSVEGKSLIILLENGVFSSFCIQLYKVCSYTN